MNKKQLKKLSKSKELFEAHNELLKEKGYDRLQFILDSYANINFSKKQLEEYENSYNKLKLEINQGVKNTKISEKTHEMLDNQSTLKRIIKESKKNLKLLTDIFNHDILRVPNTPSIETEKTQKVINISELPKRKFDFEPKAHYDMIGISQKKGIKISGSRANVLTGKVAKLERKLMNFFLDTASDNGYQEINVPCLVNEKSLIGTGQLPKFKDDVFKASDNLYLSPTGEVQLTNLYNDELLSQDELPIKLVTGTQCFRKEIGSAGRDTRGIIRQFQFQKVEIVQITEPTKSHIAFNSMVEYACKVLDLLEIPYRVVSLARNDLGFSASYTVDIEAWFPSKNDYVEISSISNTDAFQAHRANIRYKDKEGKNHKVHTLNGSAFAVGRVVACIMENYQIENGDFEFPEVL